MSIISSWDISYRIDLEMICSHIGVITYYGSLRGFLFLMLRILERRERRERRERLERLERPERPET